MLLRNRISINLTKLARDKELILTNLKAALKAKNLNQRDLAALLNKNEAEVSRWMSGRVGIGYANIDKINRVLGTDITRSSDTIKPENKQRTIGIILAAGQSSHSENPILFTEIQGKPVLAYTIEIYQNHSDIDAIEVVTSRNHLDDMRELVRLHKYNKVKWICRGGATYQDSVYNAIQNLEDEIDDNDTIVIHFGASPFTSDKIITDAINVCREKGNAFSIIPCHQLMGNNDIPGESTQWVDRDKIIQLACPQCFGFRYIQHLYEEAAERNLLSKVEPHTVSLMYLMGHTVYTSYGDQTNIKITTREDLDIFEGFVLLKKYRKKNI